MDAVLNRIANSVANPRPQWLTLASEATGEAKVATANSDDIATPDKTLDTERP